MNNDDTFLQNENEIYCKKNNNNKILGFIIYITNITILFFNLIYHFKNLLNHSQKTISFKSNDNLIINIFQKTYYDISNYLNNKYNIIINNKIHKEKSKKRLKIYCVDFHNKTKQKLWLEKKIEDKFIIEYDKDNPDYLLYNIFGKKHENPKYKNAIKIGIFTENRIPDLNKVDYALGHFHINYLDRYFKHSIFLWQNFKAINEKRKEVLKMPKRTKFCAAVISNCQKAHFRLNFINDLSKYKKIDMAGKCRNNIGGLVKDKVNFLSTYKFSIAMENSSGDGYVSEKIVHSFIAGTIPIYYGDYMIDEYINPKSYIIF